MQKIQKPKLQQSCFTKANERLNEGIKNQYFTEVQHAQSMIKGVKSIKAQEDEH